MKLEYDDLQKKRYCRWMFWVLIVIFISSVSVLVMCIAIVEIQITLIMLCFIVVIMGCGVFQLLKNNKKNLENIKQNGTKLTANILETCTIRKNMARGFHSIVKGIKIEYADKQVTIEWIKENNAYILLKMLLNPYPIKEKIYIPIDIYIDNHKIYADLESVDFTRVERYGECKKMIDEMKESNK